MMRLTRTAIGLLTAQYRSVLRKCFLINVGLYALLAPAASLTTATAVAVTAMPKTAVAWDEITGDHSTETITKSYSNQSGGVDHMLLFAKNAQIKELDVTYNNNENGGTFSGESGLDGFILLRSSSIVNAIISSSSNTMDPTNTQAWGNLINEGSSSITGVLKAYFYANSLVSHEGVSGTDLNAALGAGMLNQGNIKSIIGSFVENSATSDSGNSFGGAIYNSATIGSIGTANYKATFRNNTATSATGKVYGGAIYNTGTISGDINADFTGNQAIDGTGHDGYGGAIYNSGDIKGKIIGTFRENKVGTTGSSSAQYMHGGAIYNNGNIKAIDADFINNEAETVGNNSSAVPFGAGIYNASEKTIGTVKGNFIGNKTKVGSSQLGAGLFNAGNIDSVTGNFVQNSVNTTYEGRGAGIANSGGTIQNISGVFLNNSVSSSTNLTSANWYGAWGAGISNYSWNNDNPSVINTINADFIGNTLSANARVAEGAGIYNADTITSITGDFVGNSATSSDSTFGGGIYNIGTISGNVNANFIGNKVTTNSTGRADGAAIYNGGTMGNIGSSTQKALFVDNTASSDGSAYGVAILVRADGGQDATIKDIYADFINNHSSGKGYNTGIIYMGAMNDTDKVKIDSITGNFINNYIDGSSAPSAPVQGGAIYMATNTTIDRLNANFINTRAISANTGSYGGAIEVTASSSGGINSIVGDFINNAATSTSGQAMGGAIINYGTITNVTGEFKGNTVSRTSSQSAKIASGGAIYNCGRMNITDSYFNGNQALIETTGGGESNGGAITNEYKMTITDSSFLNNKSYNAGWAIKNYGELTLNAKDKDVLFYGQKYDLSNVHLTTSADATNVNLNASKDHKIVFNGAITGPSTEDTQTININQGNDGAQTGGEYVFNGTIMENNINLYNGANVRFGNVRQQDGTTSRGVLKAANTTVDTNGAYINVADQDGTGWQMQLGNLTLNGDLKVGIDRNLTWPQTDGINATSITANDHKIYIDYINAYEPASDETTGRSYSHSGFVTENIKSIVELSPTLHINSAYEWDGYSAVYDPEASDLTLTKVDTGTENLAGFLVKDETGTSYDMSRDEQILVDLDEGGRTMAGTTKTVNANGHNIIGNQHAGVTLADGQTLTINDANVEGFHKEDGLGAFIKKDYNSNVTINNSVFRNNSVVFGSERGRGGVLYGYGFNIIDSSFYNNSAIMNPINYYAAGGVLDGSANIYARTKDSVFEGNYATGVAPALFLTGTSSIIGQNGNKVIFSNNSTPYASGVMHIENSEADLNVTIDNAEFLYNESGLQAGAILNRADLLDVSNTLFKGNSAGTLGGAIVNEGQISISDSTFENNTATESGGAIYNAGEISKIEDSTFEGNLVAVTGTADAQGAAIYNAGTIGNVDAEFRNNLVEAENGRAQGSAIYNAGEMSKISGVFEQNMSISALSSLADIFQDGAAIKNEGNIGEIAANFINNSNMLSAGSYARGGAINNFSVIENINSNFEGNYVLNTSNSGGANGGAIWNANSADAQIGNIFGTFTNNYSLSTGGAAATGGAIFENSSASIGNILADFIGNHAMTTNNGAASGGAIRIQGGAVVTNIGSVTKGSTFTGNYAMASGSGAASGGAIYNVSTIGQIGTSDNHAKFEGNYAQANTGDAYGGAIYNAGTIDNIYADFKDNHVSSASGYGIGGAIYNTGTIKNLTGRFDGNGSSGKANSDFAGTTVANYGGNIKITNSIFTNDTKTSLNYNGSVGNVNGKMILDNSIISNNSNINGNGMLYNNGGYLKVSNSIIQNNTTGYGAGLYSGLNYANTSYLIVDNTRFENNTADNDLDIGHSSAVLIRQNATIIDSQFLNNINKDQANKELHGVAYNNYDNAVSNFIAKNNDIIFRGNTDVDGNYKDVQNSSSSTLNLNAATNRAIDFGGSVIGSGTININKSGLTYTDLKDDGTFETETKDITQAGGDYIFRNQVSGQTMNLYDGANVQLRNLRQADGTTSYGNLSLTGFTSTGAGNILDTGNGRVDTSGQLALGTTTLNANTNLRLDVNLANATASAGDLLSGTWSSGSGNFVIDSINILGTGATTQALINNDTLKSHIAMASTYHTFEQDYKDRYTVTYSNGYLNFNQNKTGTLNLVGFLSNQDAASLTEYNMATDEPVLRAIGPMAGTNNTKTVNAGDYTINGNAFAGVTVNPGQTLNIDGGVWEGFQQNAIDTSTADGVKTVNINNSTFRYNTTIGGEGGPAIDNNIGSKTTIVDSQFIQNQILGGSSGGAIWNSAELTIKAENRNVEFQGNSAPSSGAIGNYGAGTTTINATGGDVVFKNNTAGKNGGAIYSSGTLNINATGGDVIFKNNEAGTQGGAIYNAGTLDISGTSNHKVIFDGNTSSLQGGAIYSPNGTSAISPVLSVDNAIFRNNRVYSDTDSTWGGAIRYSDTGNTISKLNADFINNSAESSAINYVEGGAVNIAAAIITEMNSNFTGNYVKSTYTGGGTDKVTGGAFFLWGPNSVVRNLTGIYSSNYAQAASSLAGGGAIYLMDGSSIDNLSATFTSNYALSASSDALGGAIYMAIYSSPSYLGGKISNVSNTTFTSNYAETTGKNAYGGAIANKYQQIGSINADFTGNYAKSTGEYAAGAGGMVISGDTTDNVGSGRAYGGAIFNLAQVTKDDSGNITGVVENTGVIDSISGNFKDNYVYSENGPAAGAAIYNEYGTIGQIGSADNKALFEGNKIYNIGTGFGMAGATEGGTIYNVKGTIGDIYADFTNNFGKAPDITAGTALSNFDGSVGNIVGNFTDNEMENSENGHGTLNNRAFSSVASITSIVGNFINNSIKTNKDGYGGAIMNYKITGDAANIAHIGTIEGTFENNGVTAERYVKGGAIANLDNDASVLTAVIDSVSGTFKNNYIIATGTELVEAFGGAIFNTDLISNIQNSSFVGNSVRGSTGKVYGGAIKNDGTIGTLDGDSKLLADNTGIINTSFEGNYVRGNDQSTGGAIWNSGNINLSALQSDVNFWNNKANDRYNDIYNSGTMNFNADQNKTMSFGGSIEGTGAININTGATSGGTYVFKSDVSAGNVVVGSAASNYAPATLSFEKAKQEDGSITNGTFDVDSLTINGDGNSLSTRNDKVDTNSATTLTLNNALNLQIDGDLQSHTGDSIAVTNLTAAAPKSLRLTAMNFTADPDVTTLSKTDTIDVNITGENDILAQNNAYTLASTNPDDTTEEQIEQAYLDNLTSSSRNYNKTYAFRSAKLMTSGNNQTYVQYGDAITLKWLYENYINGWKNGKYIKNNVADGGDPDSTHLTVGQALTALDSALGQNDTYDFSTQSVADVLVNNYYTKLVKKDEKFDTNEGIMDVKSLKKDTNSSQGRIIKGVSAFPSNLCAYPFDMPHTANDNHKNVILGVCDSQNQRISANDNHKNVIVMSAFKPSSYGKRSATIGSRPNQFAEILVSSTRMTRKESTRMTRKESTRMTRKESIKMTGNATTTKQAA